MAALWRRFYRQGLIIALILFGCLLLSETLSSPPITRNPLLHLDKPLPKSQDSSFLGQSEDQLPKELKREEWRGEEKKNTERKRDNQLEDYSFSTTSIADPTPCENGAKTCNFLFFKTQKTGSTSLASILFRLGMRHNRRFLIGEDHFINPFFETLPPDTRFDISLQTQNTEGIPLPDILKFWEPYLNHPTLLTIVRNPLERYLSSFRSFALPQQMSFENFTCLEEFYNRQSRDLGIHTPGELSQFVEQGGLGSRFHVVISEYFDESLLLLKRRFNWDLSDILYLPLLASCPDLEGNLLPKKDRDEADEEGEGCGVLPPASRDPEIVQEIEAKNSLEISLYQFFLSRFEEDLRSQDYSFWGELKELKRRNRQLRDRCRRDFKEFQRNPFVFVGARRPCESYVVDDSMFYQVLRDGEQGRVAKEFLLFDVNNLEEAK